MVKEALPEKVKRRVVIGGVRYTLSGEGDEEHLQKCADMVDNCMDEIQKSFGSLPEQMVAVLAACNIADQYLTLLEDTSDVSGLKEENRRLHEENTLLLKKLAQLSNAQNRKRNNARKDT